MKPSIASRPVLVESSSEPLFHSFRSGRLRRKHAIPRWLVLTVAAGMFVALIFVTFFAH